MESSFLYYITKFNKSYNSMEEYGLRLAEFAKKDAFIKAHDAQETGFAVAHNQFSDWTDAEYKAILTYTPQGNDAVAEEIEGTTYYPINWIDIGCVNQVQDQGQCGSCWAFSSVASMEAANCIARNHLEKFSEQQLVDCDTDCFGCSGGWSYAGFMYFEEHYAMTESSYPYTHRDGNCQYNSNNNTGVLA
jgi:C1A family cysteine protease